MVSANELTSKVLAKPGTPTKRQCPRAKMAIIISSITSSIPTIVLRNSDTIASLAFPSFSTAFASSVFLLITSLSFVVTMKLALWVRMGRR